MAEINEIIVKTEHQLRFENDILVDKKELTTITDQNGQETSILWHSRKINDTEYIVKSIIKNKDSESAETTQLTKFSESQTEAFLLEWERKWSTRTITDSEVKIATEEAVKQAQEAKSQANVLEKDEDQTK